MNKNVTKLVFHGLRVLLCAAVLLTVEGCIGVVGPGYGPGYYGPGYFNDYGPDVTIFGGWRGGHWDHAGTFAHRGAISRGAVGGGGGWHGGGHR